MTGFDYPNSCTYCQSRIGSTHCLLPYQLVKEYNPPKDELSRVIDLTEIHTQYGLQMLRNNHALFDWIRQRNDSYGTSANSIESQQEVVNWYDQVTESIDSSKQNIVIDEEARKETESQSDYSEWIGKQLDLESSGGISINKSESESNISSKGKKSEKVRPIPLLEFIKSQRERSTTKSESELTLDSSENKDLEILSDNRESLNHIVQDLVMSAKTAFNIHSRKRGYMKTITLKESIMSEQDLREQIGMRYTPSYNTTLDGDKTLAKEIVARHSHDCIQRWASGRVNTEVRDCILNRAAFRPPLDDSIPSRLEEDLIIFFASTMRKYESDDLKHLNIIDNVKFELERSNHTLTYDWIKNRVKFMKRKDERKLSYPIAREQGTRTLETSLEKVKIDQRVVDYINSHLQVFVNQELEKAGTEVPKMTDETKVGTFFYKLASEFLMRNKGWHNENSFATPGHLSKLEDKTGLKSRPSEAYLTFVILKKVIDKFRANFKERYPKSGGPF